MIAVLAIAIIAILYFYSPNVRHLRIRWVTLGALLAIVVWVLATTGFAIYVLNFSHYNRVYGWLGGAVVLLLWLYLSNLVVVLRGGDGCRDRARSPAAGRDRRPGRTSSCPLRSTRRIETLDRWATEDRAKGHELLRIPQEKAAAPRR